MSYDSIPIRKRFGNWKKIFDWLACEVNNIELTTKKIIYVQASSKRSSSNKKDFCLFAPGFSQRALLKMARTEIIKEFGTQIDIEVSITEKRMVVPDLEELRDCVVFTMEYTPPPVPPESLRRR